MSMTVDLVKITTGLTIYFSIEKVVDGLYWDTSNSTFKAKGSISGTNDHISLTEDSDEPGRYIVTIATTSAVQWTNGNYKCIIRNSAGDTLIDIHPKYLKDQNEVQFRLNQIV